MEINFKFIKENCKTIAEVIELEKGITNFDTQMVGYSSFSSPFEDLK
jgi:hypothetical protein